LAIVIALCAFPGDLQVYDVSRNVLKKPAVAEEQGGQWVFASLAGAYLVLMGPINTADVGGGGGGELQAPGGQRW
jgi:hypothetical protein